MKIKICGLKRPEDIEAANRIMPDYIGFVFAGTKRKISFEQARELGKHLKKEIVRVGVFVDEPAEHIIELLNDDVLDMAQLHGSEPETEIARIRRETGKAVIKAVRVSSREDILAYADCEADYLLFDNGQGTGKCFSWEILKALENDPVLQKHPYFVAGGIEPGNIRDALLIHRNAFGLDVSSGAETDGYKDPEKMQAIVTAVRNAAQQ